MANEISSQITSTVLNQTRSASQPAIVNVQAASNRQASVEGVSNRQNNANSLGVIAEDAAVSKQADSEQKVQLEQAVSDINEYVQTINRELKFRVDDALPLGRSIVTVIDSDTEETIREFPSEDALALARSIKEQTGEATQGQIEGLIISARA